MNTVPAKAKVGPKSGFLRTSCFATATMSRRRSLQMRSASTALWWLKMKTAGRCDHRCSSPRTSSRTPASAVPSSPQAVIARFTMSRRLRFSTPGIAPTANAGMMLAIASDESGTRVIATLPLA